MRSKNNLSNDSSNDLRIEPLGDSALRISLPQFINRRAALDKLRAHPGVLDVVITEQHVGIYFDPINLPDNPAAILEGITHTFNEINLRPLITIHAHYDGMDLVRVAEYAHMTPDEVAEIHAQQEYAVSVVGFMPGFAYLSEVDARIAAPRLATPRTRVPAGAIGIAGLRTGVYPFASPGGWNLIATAVDFIAFDAQSGATLQLGDRVHFERV